MLRQCIRRRIDYIFCLITRKKNIRHGRLNTKIYTVASFIADLPVIQSIATVEEPLAPWPPVIPRPTPWHPCHHVRSMPHPAPQGGEVQVSVQQQFECVLQSSWWWETRGWSATVALRLTRSCHRGHKWVPRPSIHPLGVRWCCQGALIAPSTWRC